MRGLSFLADAGLRCFALGLAVDGRLGGGETWVETQVVWEGGGRGSVFGVFPLFRGGFGVFPLFRGGGSLSSPFSEPQNRTPAGPLLPLCLSDLAPLGPERPTMPLRPCSFGSGTSNKMQNPKTG